MNQRYQEEDIDRVREEQADNELYQTICRIGDRLETELAEFGLRSEECFEEAHELLAWLAGKGEDVMPELDKLWHRKYNEYRRFDRTVGEDELRKVVGIVFGYVILATDSSRYRFYRYTLSEALVATIVRHPFEGWQSALDTIFSLPLPDGWFDKAILGECDGNENTDADKWQTLKDELKSFFYTDDNGKKELDGFVRFLQKNPKTTDITREVRRLRHEENVISDIAYKTPLYKLLHEKGIYPRKFETWRQQVD